MALIYDIPKGDEDMKRAVAVLLTLFLLTLAGCGESSLSGEVVGEPDGCLILKDGEGELFVLRLNAAIAAAEPESGSFLGAQLDIRGARRDGSMEYDGENIRAYTAESAILTGKLERSIMRLSDGTEIDVMRTPLFGDWYRLSNGTELLCEDFSVNVGDNSSDTAAEAIEAYFAGNKPYNISALLEAAYAEYRADPEGFAYHSVTFGVTPSAESERAAYFRATLSVANIVLSENSRTGEYTEFGYAFDRETGERLDTRSLFAVPWDEAREALVSATQVSDSDRAQRMADSLEPDGVSISDDGISLNYSTQAADELGLNGAYIQREDLPAGLLHSWAEPVSWHAGE